MSRQTSEKLEVVAVNSSDLVVSCENPLAEESLSLIQQLTAELAAKYGDDGGAESFDPQQAAGDGGAFLMARLKGKAVGCGAIRPLRPGVAEVKRMFVVPEKRGRGIARCILQELECTAARMGYNSIRLETGLRQPEAIGLYESAGYCRISCYGKYVANAMSVCFEKSLSGSAAD